MHTRPAYPSWRASRHVTDRVLPTVERFLQVEAVSGSVLIVAASIALVRDNPLTRRFVPCDRHGDVHPGGEFE